MGTRLKRLPSTLASEFATEAFNLLLLDGVFVDSLTIAKLAPTHQSRGVDDPGNFRSISCLRMLGKV